MNWWGRRSGLVVLLLVVLFSCEEEVSTIGIRRPNPKFRVNYAEIDLPSSVIQLEPLVTYNRGSDTDGVQRLLVGQYTDTEFGKIRTEIYAQISPPVDALGIGVTAVLDSLVLQLTTDFYYYGSESASDVSLEIHELQDTVKEVPHYSNSKIAYNPEILGQKLITIDPAEFKQGLADNRDNISTNNKIKSYRVVLNGDFAKNLFETVRTETELVNDFTAFTGKYKGFAIFSPAADKVLGIDPKVSSSNLNTGTKLVMYYTEAGTQKQVNFTLYPFASNPVMAFSSIESDRSGTVLEPLTEPFKDFYPVNNKRYVQSGTGVLTKVDFAPYFAYMDTVNNAILNSAELIFESETGEFSPPSKLQFRILNDQNRYRSFLQDTLIDGTVYEKNNLLALRAAYPYSVIPNDDGTIDIASDAVDLLTVSSNASMSGFLTSFFQDQFTQRKSEKRLKYCAIHPLESTEFSLETQFRKSVNRMILNNNIKLKFYYTTPVVETLE